MRRPSLDISRAERRVRSKSSSVSTGGVGGSSTSPFCLERNNLVHWLITINNKNLIWFEFVQNRTGNFDWKIPVRDQHAHYFLFLARTHKRILKCSKTCTLFINKQNETYINREAQTKQVTVLHCFIISKPISRPKLLRDT
jgi:hypothetical protein